MNNKRDLYGSYYIENSMYSLRLTKKKKKKKVILSSLQ